MVRTYYELAKPGIIYGNAITAAAGFLLASAGHPQVLPFGYLIAGLSLVVGSGSVFNNYIDRGIDRLMARTKDRAFATGSVSVASGLTYGTAIGLIGLALLYIGTNALTALVALGGWVVYVGVYTPAKRITPYAMHVGSVAGAVPPVAGYVAVTGQMDLGALLLFVLLFFWQMPHFLAIAVRRVDEYRAAHIPVLPLRASARAVWARVVMYIIAFDGVAFLIALAGYAGVLYMMVALLLGMWWLGAALAGYKTPDARWARRVFRLSLIVLIGVSISMAVTPCAVPGAPFCSGLL